MGDGIGLGCGSVVLGVGIDCSRLWIGASDICLFHPVHCFRQLGGLGIERVNGSLMREMEIYSRET